MTSSLFHPKTIAQLATWVVLLVVGGVLPAQIVPAGSVWRYLDDGSDQGNVWRQPGFDFSSWASGPGQLGYGDGDEATVVSFGPNPGAKYITTYFLHSFLSSGPGSSTALELRVLRDDGVIVYLNGTEIARDNLPSGVVGYRTRATNAITGSAENQWLVFTVPATLLQAGVNVIAAEIHQHTPTSSDISFDLELDALGTPLLVRGPYLQNENSDSVSVRWRTSSPTDSILRFGVASSGQLPNVIQDSTLTTEHELRVTGLPIDTRFAYSVEDSNGPLAGGSGHSFRTGAAPGAATPVRIWALGDCGSRKPAQGQVRDAFLAFNGNQPPDVWLLLGDNAYSSGLDSEYQSAVFDVYPYLLANACVWSARGNHDATDTAYYGIFTFPIAAEAGGLASGSEAYYSFDYANVHFVSLDTYASSLQPGGPMLTWLDADLAANTQRWTIVFFHHPPYTKGTHDSDNDRDSGGRMRDVRQNVLPVLEGAGVDLVLSGHSHTYERSYLIDGHYGYSWSFDPPTMLMDGGDGRVGGGGPYVKVRGPHSGTVYCVNGSGGRAGIGPLDHPVMYLSLSVPGSVILDVQGDRMDLTFLDSSGVVEDEFTMISRDPGPSLSLSSLVAGSNGTATVTFATPGDPVMLGLSLSGPGPINTSYGTVELSLPVTLEPPLVANSSGAASWTLPLPPGMTGRQVWVQALEFTSSGAQLFTPMQTAVIG